MHEEFMKNQRRISMKKTTVVFDLDGTLLDTLQDLANAVNYALEQQGMPKRTLEEVRQFVGNGVRLLIREREKSKGLFAHNCHN